MRKINKRKTLLFDLASAFKAKDAPKYANLLAFDKRNQYLTVKDLRIIYKRFVGWKGEPIVKNPRLFGFKKGLYEAGIDDAWLNYLLPTPELFSRKRDKDEEEIANMTLY